MLGAVLLPNWAYQRELQRALGGACVALDQRLVVRELWRCYQEVRQGIPRTYPLQVRLLLALAFDVTACPLARFYLDHDAAHVCQVAACELDHDLARAWRVGFRRTTTIAEGGDRCDFRFVAGG
jgi:hypothetical protein